MPTPNWVDAKTVLSNDGRKVRVLFYDDGSYRFRVYDCPLVLEEAYLSGNAQGNSIIKLAPNLAAPPRSDKTTSARARELETENKKLRVLLIDAVTRVGNHPNFAPIVPEIQELTGTSDFGS